VRGGAARAPPPEHPTREIEGPDRSALPALSRRGVFIETEHPLDIGARVELRIQIQDTGEVIEIPVEVVSQNLGPGFEREPWGMGLRFRDAGPEVEKQIEELYERAVREAAG